MGSEDLAWGATQAAFMGGRAISITSSTSSSLAPITTLTALDLLSILSAFLGNSVSIPSASPGGAFSLVTVLVLLGLLRLVLPGPLRLALLARPWWRSVILSSASRM